MNISVKNKSIISNETAEIANFHFAHFKSINIYKIATKIAGQTYGFWKRILTILSKIYIVCQSSSQSNQAVRTKVI